MYDLTFALVIFGFETSIAVGDSRLPELERPCMHK